MAFGCIELREPIKNSYRIFLDPDNFQNIEISQSQRGKKRIKKFFLPTLRGKSFSLFFRFFFSVKRKIGDEIDSVKRYYYVKIQEGERGYGMSFGSGNEIQRRKPNPVRDGLCVRDREWNAIRCGRFESPTKGERPKHKTKRETHISDVEARRFTSSNGCQKRMLDPIDALPPHPKRKTKQQGSKRKNGKETS